MSLIRRDTYIAAQAMNDLKALAEIWAIKNVDNIKRSCGSCVYAVKEGPFKCSTFDAVPPLNIILNGCDSHSDIDDLPF